VHKKLIADSVTLKDLIAFVVASNLAVAFFVISGSLDAIGNWERMHHLSNLHVEAIVIVLIVSGIAATIFFIRRYKELRGDILEEQGPWKGSRSGQKQTIPRDNDMESLFYQVETAKKEWERSVDSIEHMVILSGLDGTIHRCNRAFKDFIGRSYEEILGRNLASLLSNFAVEMKDFELKNLNARLNIMGKWFIMTSSSYEDSEAGNITKVVIIMHNATTERSARVQFVWGRAGDIRPDESHANRLPASPGTSTAAQGFPPSRGSDPR